MKEKYGAIKFLRVNGINMKVVASKVLLHVYVMELSN